MNQSFVGCIASFILCAAGIFFAACSDFSELLIDDSERWSEMAEQQSSSEDLSSSSSEKYSSSKEVESSSSEKEKRPAISYGMIRDDRDGQSYRTVAIGSQTWMAENLNYNYADRSSINSCYNDEKTNCETYGRLYTWSAAMDSLGVFSKTSKYCGYGSECNAAGLIQGICPRGWHLPNDEEWKALLEYVGGASIAGKKLKSTHKWKDDGNGVDYYGFSALPAGARNYLGKYVTADKNAFFWSSSVIDSEFASCWSFGYDSDDAGQMLYNSDFAFSVRCIKD